MQVNETLKDGLRRALDMRIPSSELGSKLDARLHELKGQVNLKGFRPGKVPFVHMKKVYGRSVMGDVLQEAISSGIQTTLDERNEKAALQPKIDLPEDEGVLDKIMSGDSDLEFSVSYEVLPDITLGDFKSISIERPVVVVEDSDVQQQLDVIVEQNRPYHAKAEGEPAADGDRLNIKFLGKVDGEPFEGGASEGSPLVLGSNTFVPGFEEQLAGMTTGDKKIVEVTFPEDYRNENLAGKDAHFDVEVLGVETPEDIALDDEFAKKLGLESLDQLRETVNNRIRDQFTSMSNGHVKRLILDALDEMHRFEVPAQLLDQEFDAIWERVTHDMKHHDRTFEQEGTTEEEARKQYREIADRRVRLGLVIAEIGNTNKIEVTEQEHQQALIAEVQKFPGKEQQVYDYFRNNHQALAGLRAPVFEDKVVKFVTELVDVVDKTVSKEELVKLVEEKQEEDAEAHHLHD